MMFYILGYMADSNYGPKPTENAEGIINAEMLSFWLAAVLPVHYMNKHSLLTTTSTVTRLRVLKTFMYEGERASERERESEREIMREKARERGILRTRKGRRTATRSRAYTHTHTRRLSPRVLVHVHV